jgi:hypothetical protein
LNSMEGILHTILYTGAIFLRILLRLDRTDPDGYAHP